MAKAAVIILNWNGVELMKEFLPSVIKNTPPELGKVIVADNASTDNSVEWLQSEHPDVQLISFDKNHGFAGGYNRAIAAVEEEIVVLLNSDVEVAAGWLAPLLELLDRENEVVAVQPKIKAWRDKKCFEYAGAAGGYMDRLGFPFCRGRILDVVEQDRGQYDDVKEVFWCSGAALCIRRKAYLEAGGLDERFFAHMEEIDLCWRIRNKGGKLLVCPQSVVYHLGGGSLPMNHPRKLFLNYRNNLLMLYKNLSQEEWNKIIRKRRMLDFAAYMVFLLKREWKNAQSVKAAYREFGVMKKMYTKEQIDNRGDHCIFRGCILFEYYFRRIRTFSDLWK